MSEVTYSHYGTPDAVAKKWADAIAMHQRWVATCFEEYRANRIDLETLERRCQMHALAPIDDALMGATMAWGIQQARRIERLQEVNSTLLNTRPFEELPKPKP